MEEILASIRRIISEEDDGGEDAPAEAADVEIDETVEVEATVEAEDEAEEEAVAEPEAEEEVLELTQKVNEDGSVTELEAEEEAEPEPEPDLEPMEAADDIVAVEPGSAEGETLLSQEAAATAAASFGALARNIAVSSSGDGRTLEDIVQELLKPILKDWLDEHLPPMVEELVREEISRVAKRGRMA